MAKTYSKIQRNFWETDEAREMTPEEKYFWMYLQTNSNVNTLGCYTFRMRKAMDETGYNKETLEKLLEKMVQVLRILYDRETGEVFLLNNPENYWNKKTATLRAITADLKEIKSKTLKEAAKKMLENAKILASDENEKDEKCFISAEESRDKEQKGTTGNKRSEEEEEEEEEEKKKIYTSDSAEFFVFWREYPNKKNKQTAIARWDRMKITPALYEKIMEGLARAKASQEWAAQRGRYIPYPASWLNAGGWENEYRPMEESRPPKPKAPNDGLAKRLGR